jgi:hypothetical protein
MKNVCRVMGTGVKGKGIAISAPTAVKAAKRAQRIIPFVFSNIFCSGKAKTLLLNRNLLKTVI